jgi:molybdate transport system regulatory protein
MPPMSIDVRRKGSIDVRRKGSIDNVFEGELVYHFTEDELKRLTEAFYSYYEEDEKKGNKKRAMHRAKHLLFFLFLRFTGARIGEIQLIDESRDIDLRLSQVHLVSLKKFSKRKKGKMKRTVPVPESLINEYLRLIKIYPEIEGKVFKIPQSVFFRVFRKICEIANIPKNLAHPHTLRHTRAIELLRAQVPVTIVQQILGHSSLSTTAMYLKFSASEVRMVMKDRGVI